MHLCPYVSVLGGQDADCGVFVHIVVIYILELAGAQI